MRSTADMLWLLPLFVLAADAFLCPRFQPGDILTEPEHIYSNNLGTLSIDMVFQHDLRSDGIDEYCFSTAVGNVCSPTLHLIPGGHLTLKLTNLLPGNASYHTILETFAINLHFHGMHVSPAMGQDSVMIEILPGASYTYELDIPVDHVPGLFWYHTHIHKATMATVLGGASGQIIVEGLENYASLVAGLPYRTLTFRDVVIPDSSIQAGSDPPSWDLSINFIPVSFPKYIPVQIPMRPNAIEFWRVLHAGAGSILLLQIEYDGVPQPIQILQVVALDGSFVSSQDLSANKTTLKLAGGNRAEFIIRAPSISVRSAKLITEYFNTGPDGDYDPRRDLAVIRVSSSAAPSTLIMPVTSKQRNPSPPDSDTVQNLLRQSPQISRTLIFSQEPSNDPDKPSNFFVTVAGQTPTLFSLNDHPAIVTRQGSIEDWVIQNTAREVHEFHIHQVRFLVLEVNGVALPPNEVQFFDTYDVTFWTGTGPVPSIKIRIDFSKVTVGTFVYHCHLLEHEDFGMMAAIQVLPPGAPFPTIAVAPVTSPASSVDSNSNTAIAPFVGGTLMGVAGVLVATGVFIVRQRIWTPVATSDPSVQDGHLSKLELRTAERGIQDVKQDDWRLSKVELDFPKSGIQVSEQIRCHLSSKERKVKAPRGAGRYNEWYLTTTYRRLPKGTVV